MSNWSPDGYLSRVLSPWRARTHCLAAFEHPPPPPPPPPPHAWNEIIPELLQRLIYDKRRKFIVHFNYLKCVCQQSFSRYEFYRRLTFLRHAKSSLVLHAGNHATRSVSWVSTLEFSGAIQCYALSSAFLIRSLRKWRGSIRHVFSTKLAPKMILFGP